jgi:hypothetical protein
LRHTEYFDTLFCIEQHYGGTMRKLSTISIISLVSAISCIPIGDYDKETGETFDTEEQEEEVLPIEISVSWGDSSITLDLVNGDQGASYYWGLAENNGTCLTEGWCWTGEDCFMGYDLTEGGNYTYCHPVNTNGGMLFYGASPDAVEAGSTTVFSSTSFSVDVTHILDNQASLEDESCWVWGADTNYYNGYEKDCQVM